VDAGTADRLRTLEKLMQAVEREYPCLRYVEAIPDERNGRVILRDPTQLAAGVLVVGRAELELLSLLDGEHGWMEIQAEYARRSGQLLLSHELEAVLDQLDSAGYLQGAGFEAYYAGLVDEYRSLPYRPLRQPDGFGAPAAALPAYLDRAMAQGRRREPEQPAPNGRLAAIVAPHLDFPRGNPCYGPAYDLLRRSLPGWGDEIRVVVLGANHFGRSRSVVATGKDFQTPWGVAHTDRPFLEQLQAECGGNLTPHEMDHLREHSIELQAIWLHHVLGDGVRIVPVLCPNPSGPLGTAPGDPDGVDLREFSLALGRLIREDPTPTLLVASADLSHVGGYFGDEEDLDAGLVAAAREADEAGLALVSRNDPEALRRHMASTGNPTRWCSIGCLYATLTALGPTAAPQRLRYHQAITEESQNCVTCAAFAVYLP